MAVSLSHVKTKQRIKKKPVFVSGYPNTIDAYALTGEDDIDVMRSTQRNIVRPDGRTTWVTARPISSPSLFRRIKLAWDVFRGHADALYWKCQ